MLQKFLNDLLEPHRVSVLQKMAYVDTMLYESFRWQFGVHPRNHVGSIAGQVTRNTRMSSDYFLRNRIYLPLQLVHNLHTRQLPQFLTHILRYKGSSDIPTNIFR